MDYEKKYKEALEMAKKIRHDVALVGCYMDNDVLELIFPELNEMLKPSDDKIVEILKSVVEDAYCGRVSKAIPTDIEYEACLEWIEKKKAIKWTYQDESLFRCAIDAVKQESKVRKDGCLDEEVGEKVIKWLEGFRPKDCSYDL